MHHEYKSRCHPEADGKKPKVGDQQYSIDIPLEGGDTPNVRLGQGGYDAFRRVFEQMAIDDLAGGQARDWSDGRDAGSPS